MSLQFAEKLLTWFGQHARLLPWRGQRDPYIIWVSEIMLQQTRVETVIPYYERWVERFPDLFTLANADVQEVLSAWEGLGYYRRARDLHRAAQIVVKEHNGSLPPNAASLRKLPGIGRYTAGAIAAFAFGLDEPVLDGNIKRVLSRVFNMRESIRSSAGERKLWGIVSSHLPPGHASDYNQALMDLGATICTPHNPDCTSCPLNEMCIAFADNLQDELPVKPAKEQIPHHTASAAVIHRENRVLIAQRPSNGLLGSMWEFPGARLKPGEDRLTCLKREIFEDLGIHIQVERDIGEYRHTYTHFRVTLHAYLCSLQNGSELSSQPERKLRWAAVSELSGYPMGKIDRQIASRLASGNDLFDPLTAPRVTNTLSLDGN